MVRAIMDFCRSFPFCCTGWPRLGLPVAWGWWMCLAGACAATPAANPDLSTASETDEVTQTSASSCDSRFPAAPLRRLSAEQYTYTVQDLFGGADLTLAKMVGAPPGSRFDHLTPVQQPSALWTYQVHQSAVDVAAQVVDRLPALQACATLSVDQAVVCGDRFLVSFLPRLLRRPPHDDERAAYAQLLRDMMAEHPVKSALALLLQAALQDPNFLYLTEFDDQELAASDPHAEDRVAVGPYALASRLSYFFWHSMPDDALLQAANNGELMHAADLHRQAQRMLADERAQRGILNYFRQSFELDKIDALTAPKEGFPEFTVALRQAMRREIELRIVEEIWQGNGRWRELLLGNRTSVNGELAALYGVDPPKGDAWESRELNADQRAGLLTSAGFLAAHAVHLDPSPVRRGLFVLDRLLCRATPLPDASVDLTVPSDPGSKKTNRQRFAEHVANPACMGCHQIIDGIGFGFEAYDAMGRLRSTDAGQAIDESGVVVLQRHEHRFNGAVELAHLLANAAEADACVVNDWLRYALARELGEGDQCGQQHTLAAFVDHDSDLKHLMLTIATSDFFRFKARSNR